LTETGAYSVDEGAHERIQGFFWSDWAKDVEALEAIRETHFQYGYVLDPHTAVARVVYERYRDRSGDTKKTVVLSTASPFKFNRHVVCALLGENAGTGRGEFELLDLLAAYTGWPVPEGLKNLEQQPVRHERVVSREEMKEAVLQILGLS
jgi:threonine synthase